MNFFSVRTRMSEINYSKLIYFFVISLILLASSLLIISNSIQTVSLLKILGTPHQKFWKDILDYKCYVYRLSDNTQEFRKSGDVLLKAQEEVIHY